MKNTKFMKMAAAVFLSMSMVITMIPTLAFAVDSAPSDSKPEQISEGTEKTEADKSDEKAASNEEDGNLKDSKKDIENTFSEKQAKPQKKSINNEVPKDEKSGDMDVKISVSGHGSATAIQVGKNEEARIEILSGKSKKLNTERGKIVEVTAYADTDAKSSYSSTGAECIGTKKLHEQEIRYSFKITGRNSEIKIAFKGGFVSRALNVPKRVRRNAVMFRGAPPTITSSINVIKYQYGYTAGGAKTTYNKYGLFSGTGFYNNAIYCGEHAKTATVGTYKLYPYNNALMRKVTFYGYRGPKEWSGFSSPSVNVGYKLWGSNTNRTEIAGACITAQALSNAYKQFDSNAGGVVVTNLCGLSAFMDYINSQPDPGDTWQLYGLYASGQNMFGGIYNPKGKCYVKKEIANNKKLTEECKNMYSLAGAKYGVFKGSEQVAVLTTGADGKSNVAELDAGAYTIREIEAPKGYALDQKVYTVTITVGETATIESKDSPVFDPINIILQKVADGKSYLNTDADMSDAEFTISYYDEMTDDVTGKTPKRVWKLKTSKAKNGKYFAMLRKANILEGSDELYKDENGIIVIPRGTVTMQETKAPKGFKVDNNIYKFKVDVDSEDNSVIFNLGNTPEQPNKPLVPKIRTTAKDSKTGDAVGEYGKKMKLIDTVSYSELSEGEEYTVKGVLMDKGTNKPLLDAFGKEITAEKTFTVTKENSTIDGNGARGKVNLEYEVDSTLLSGKTTVVFENLYYKGKELATHADITDEGQTVHFPGVKTTAKSKETGNNFGMPGKMETLIDEVKCRNLVIGKEYTVKGTLRNKETGEAIKDKEGKEITAEKTFPADKANCTVELTFTYDSSLRQGKATVVFEDLYHENIKVGTHADLKDIDQTIEYPDIGTKASFKYIGNEGKGKPLTIVDMCMYKNLAPGKEYTVKGVLMDKETNKPFLVNGKEVRAEQKFNPAMPGGFVNVEFTFDGKAIKGKTVVVFEEVYYKGEKIMEHKDINDKDQTLAVGELDVQYPQGGFPLTGDDMHIIIFAALIAASAGVIYLIRKKKLGKHGK